MPCSTPVVGCKGRRFYEQMEPESGECVEIEEWGRLMTAPPCLGCPDRRIGCHDPAVCPRWAAYDEIHRAELAAMPSRKEWEDMVEYIHDRRRRYMPGRWKKGDK